MGGGEPSILKYRKRKNQSGWNDEEEKSQDKIKTGKILETKQKIYHQKNKWISVNIHFEIFSALPKHGQKKELRKLNQRTKMITLQKDLHPRNDVDRLCVKKKKGGSGSVNIENEVDSPIKGSWELKKVEKWHKSWQPKVATELKRENKDQKT